MGKRHTVVLSGTKTFTAQLHFKYLSKNDSRSYGTCLPDRFCLLMLGYKGFSFSLDNKRFASMLSICPESIVFL